MPLPLALDLTPPPMVLFPHLYPLDLFQRTTPWTPPHLPWAPIFASQFGMLPWRCNPLPPHLPFICLFRAIILSPTLFNSPHLHPTLPPLFLFSSPNLPLIIRVPTPPSPDFNVPSLHPHDHPPPSLLTISMSHLLLILMIPSTHIYPPHTPHYNQEFAPSSLLCTLQKLTFSTSLWVQFKCIWL